MPRKAKQAAKAKGRGLDNTYAGVSILKLEILLAQARSSRVEMAEARACLSLAALFQCDIDTQIECRGAITQWYDLRVHSSKTSYTPVQWQA